jgi:hypothetical protein
MSPIHLLRILSKMKIRSGSPAWRVFGHYNQSHDIGDEADAAGNAVDHPDHPNQDHVRIQIPSETRARADDFSSSPCRGYSRARSIGDVSGGLVG